MEYRGTSLFCLALYRANSKECIMRPLRKWNSRTFVVLAFITHTFQPLITSDRQRLIQPFSRQLVTLGKRTTQKLTHILKRVLSIVQYKSRNIQIESARILAIATLYFI